MRKIGKKTVVIFAVIALVLAAIIGTYIYISGHRITDIGVSLSPDGNRSLYFQSVGEPDFTFGDSHARLVLKNGSATVAEYAFDVANDGKTLAPENWSADWGEAAVSVIISGEEQQDMQYILNYDCTVYVSSP